MKGYRFFAEGEPKGQPRPRAYSRGGHTRVYNPGTTDAWKADIKRSAAPWVKAEGSLIGPVKVIMHFLMNRPKSHFRTGKFADQLKPDQPQAHTSKPDVDNMAKPILDALTESGVWADDSQVCDLYITKRYGENVTGCEIAVAEVES